MMLSLRALKQRLWLCLGLTMVIAGGTAATMGYLAARETAAMPTLVTSAAAPTKAQPTTKKSGVTATTRTSGKTSRTVGATTRKSSVAGATSKSSAPTTARSAPIIANANAPAVSISKWRGMMWWGAAMLAVGVVSVAYSIHEMRPKAPPTGADELLNDAPPF